MERLTLIQLRKIEAAYAERLYREVRLPALQASFANYTDEDCRKIIASGEKKNPVREKAFEKLAAKLMPPHMRAHDPQQTRREPVEPLEGISAAAARGMMQAALDGLLSHSQWLQVAPVMEQIRAAAKQDAVTRRP